MAQVKTWLFMAVLMWVAWVVFQIPDGVRRIEHRAHDTVEYVSADGKWVEVENR